MYINIKIKEDFRTLKANQEYNFDFSEKGWHLIVGGNGCGKSTLLNTIRSFKCDNIDDRTCSDYDMKLMYESINSFKDKVEIDSDFEKFYFISSEFDDPRALDNCASAEALFKHGGFATKNLSNGQRHLSILARWIEENKKEWDEKTLLIFDEADRGFGLKYQVGLITMFDNFLEKYNAKSLAVSHYSLPILLTDEVYWFEKRQFIPSDFYILFETGYMFETPKLIVNKR